MFKCGLIEQETVAKRFQDALALFVGRKRRFSNETLGEASGIKPRTIKAYCEGANTPGLHSFLSLAAVMPVAWTNSILSLASLRAEPIGEGEGDAPTVMCNVTKFAARLAEMLADGRIDHMERAALPAMLRSLAEQLLAWAKKLEDEGGA